MIRLARPKPNLLRDHDFRQLFVADAISQVGAQVGQLAIPLVAVISLGARPVEVGLLVTVQTAAFLLVGLPAGAWVDRMRRRSVMIVADVGRALLLGSIPVAWYFESLTIGQLYVVAGLVGVLTVFFDVAYQSYLPHLVGRDRLVEGNATLEVVCSTTSLAGPGTAGAVIQALTAPFAIIANAFGFAVSALFVGLIRKREQLPPKTPGRHLGREVLEGLRFVLGNRLLRAIAACTGSFNLCWSAATAMEIVFFVRVLHMSPKMIGLFFSIGAIGGLIGAFMVNRVVAALGQGRAIWLSAAVTTPFVLLVPAAAPGWRIWLAAVANIVVGIGIVVYNVTQVSFRQGITPEHLLGRMNATMRFFVWGTMPLGAFLGGLLGEAFGARTTLWIGYLGACLAFLPVFFSPLRKMRELPKRPEGEAAPAEQDPTDSAVSAI